MKIFVGFFLVFVFIVNTYASPLVFKVEKEVNIENYTLVASFDATKYKRLRVVVTNPTSKTFYNYTFSVSILGVENDESFILGEYIERQLNYSQIIEVPPTKVNISVKGKGITKVFIYGDQ